MEKSSWAKLLVLISALISIFIFSAVPALADCCVYQGTCTASSSGCPPGYFIQGQTCSQLPDCQIGCCCPESTAMFKGACSDPENFVENPLLNPGDTCTCGSGFTISGKVKRDGVGEGDALVSVGSISTTSSGSSPNQGSYSLTGLPGGSVTVTATKDGCSGSVQIPNLNSDRTGVDINLQCTCTPGCVVNQTSYCDNDHILHYYNVSNPSQQAQYCLYCSEFDENVCGPYSMCRPGDGACPLGCSANPSGPGYDSDCACSLVPNGYCPGQCNSDTDADCGIIFEPICGDGLVFYPFETCELNPQQGQATYCQAQSCSNCNCISNELCGNGQIDPGEQCELGNICSNGAACLDCSCSGSCSGLNINPAISSSFDLATRQVRINWALSDSCNSIVRSYYLLSCKKDGSNLCTDPASFQVIGTYPRSQFNTSVLVEQSSEYKFQVKAFFEDDRIGVSQVITVKTGSDFCMNRGPEDPEEFCMENKRSRCDTNNNIKTIEDCNPQGKYCSGPDYSGTTTCESTDTCGLCNGLYGMFGKYLDLKVSLGQDSYFCNPGAGRDVIPGCYYDKTRFLFKAFSSCGNVRDCYDFKSEAACTDPLDPCGITSQCEWKSLPSNPSLGGVCRPKDIQQQDCTKCDDSLYNWIGPVCTPEVCGLFGTCYYQGLNNSPSCANTLVSSCEKYETKDKCIGAGSSARPVSVDAAYNSSHSRVSGTHIVTESNDNLGLGKCYWDSINSKCRRDADGLPFDPDENIGADCAPNDFQCQSDFTEPQTNILVSALGLYPAAPKINYNVVDNYPANKMKTYFCVAKSGAPPCYPNEPGVISPTVSQYSASRINVSGTYRLYYYSEDPAKNLEVVQSIILQVDADPPFIEFIDPKNESGFGVNTPTLKIQARTAPDASYVCANNTAIKQTVCINNCAKPGAGTPCINDQGYFNLTVPIVQNTTGGSSNTPRDVVFTAEDFAGNIYKNTILGIIYDVTPPNAPVIIIK